MSHRKRLSDEAASYIDSLSAEDQQFLARFEAAERGRFCSDPSKRIYQGCGDQTCTYRKCQGRCLQRLAYQAANARRRSVADFRCSPLDHADRAVRNTQEDVLVALLDFLNCKEAV